MRRHLLRVCAVFCLLAGAGLMDLGSARMAQARPTSSELEAAKSQLHALFADRKYVVALPVAERVVALAKAVLGPDDIYVGTAHSNFGVLLQRTGRLKAAAVQLQHAFDIFHQRIAPSHARYRALLRSLVQVNTQLRRLAPAEAAYVRALKTLEISGHGRTQAATNLLNDLGMLYRGFGKLDAAERTLRKALVVKEAILERGDASIAITLSNLAGAVRAAGKFRDAEPLYKRAIAIMGKAKGRDNPNVAILSDNLAVLYLYLGRYGEAEKLSKRALAVLEGKYGLEHASVGQVVANLAEIYRVQRRYSEAESMFQRALAVFSKTLPRHDYRIGFTLDNLAGLYREQGRPRTARPYYERAIETLRIALPSGHPDIAHATNNLALVLADLGDFEAAEGLFKLALALARKTYAPGHREIAVGMANLADVYLRTERHDEAAQLLRKAIVSLKQSFGEDHPALVWPLRDLGRAEMADGNILAGLQHMRDAVGVHLAARRRQFGGARDGNQLKVLKHGPYQSFVNVAWQVASRHPQKTNALAAESLLSAQWASLTRAGSALSQLAVRVSAGDVELASLVRERQDLEGEWRAMDKRLTDVLSRDPGKRDRSEEQRLRKQVQGIKRRLAGIDDRLARTYPDFAALADPKPLRVGAIQSLLRSNEALVQFLVGEKATYVWVVRPSDVLWHRLDIGREELRLRVARLRCGLDDALWYDKQSAKRCQKLAGPRSEDGQLPFDVAAAHQLYQDLLEPVSESLFGRHLLIVPTGPLTSLPFSVLVTKPALEAPKNYAKVAWLIRSHPMTVLPSAQSLAALRRGARASRAPFPYVGFGNPLLLGAAGKDKRAWQYQDCRKGRTRRRVARVGRAISRRIKTFFRGAQGNVAELRKLSALPETADELCSVAENLHARHADVVLGARATERLVRDLGRSGRLAKYRVVHFATHGLIAGELNGLAEPALVLTPPKVASDDDDGLLTASEIAKLKLDADWVILSACNTASGDKIGAEPLSGLARAFFYAGSRSLLVSHWPVQSQAAIKLTVTAIEQLRGNPAIGRAEALRRSMLAMISKGASSGNAHPQVWAPFVIIGEGGGGGVMKAATAPFPLSALGGGRSGLGKGNTRGGGLPASIGAGSPPAAALASPARRSVRRRRPIRPAISWKKGAFGGARGGAAFGLD